MSKIICEVCGTSYPETSAQCPICGYVHPAAGAGAASDMRDGTASREYTYVKGGRFSQANVRKRNRAKASVATGAKQSGTRQSTNTRQSNTRQSDSRQNVKKKKESSGNTGLIITIFVLLLAIIAVIGYIFIKFFMPTVTVDEQTVPAPETTQTEQTTEASLDCQEIILDSNEIVLTSVGETTLIFADVLPADTPDILEFMSSDPLIATVDANGMVTAIGAGEATITVSCGAVSVDCTVICDFIPETEETTLPLEELRLNREQIRFASAGERWVVYSGSIPNDQITWSSDDESVAVIADGTVTAVGNGETIVYAEYNGTVVSCEIICEFSDAEAGQEGNGGVSEDGGNESQGNGNTAEDNKEYHLDNLYSQYDTEVNLSLGSSFPLRLVDEDGNAVDATWSVQNSSVCSVDEDGDVTAKSIGQTYVIATYNGKEYRCLVRVV